jgi:NTE family protein
MTNDQIGEQSSELGTLEPADPGGAASTKVDLVLEGGGVKGIALVGAVRVLAEHGCQIERIAGTSAGAITAAVVAAMRQYGEPLDRLDDIVLSLDYRRFRDRGPLARWSGPLRPVFDGLNVLLDNGVFEGDYLLDWLTGTLADLGVRTFADLRLPDDPGSGLPESHRYRAVMIASDVSRNRVIRLPWDLPAYGHDPDAHSVALAARMSASIPYYFEPVTLKVPGRGTATIVDGAVFSNYPIPISDRTDGAPPRWPTFGIRLCTRPSARPRTQAVKGPVSLGLALAESMIGAWDAMHVDEPCTARRTIFVDTSGVSAVDFDISRERQRTLLAAGRNGAEEFLANWDFEDHVKVCRGGPQ